MQNNKLVLFEEKRIRRLWFKDDWYYSIVDVIEVLTKSERPRKYWNDLKNKLLGDEGFEVSDFFGQLKMKAEDGKLRETDCANTRGILRIIQSIPSPNAEPFKLWLAEVGNDRIEEINDPELGISRIRDIYKKKGYDKAWIAQREKTIDTRNRLTDEWSDRGAKKGLDFAILTNEIYKEGFGMDAKEYKDFKGVSKKGNLRDSMNYLELALTNLGEVTATELHIDNDSIGMEELKEDVKSAGEVTKYSRLKIEEKLKHSVISKVLPNKLN